MLNFIITGKLEREQGTERKRVSKTKHSRMWNGRNHILAHITAQGNW